MAQQVPLKKPVAIPGLTIEIGKPEGLMTDAKGAPFAVDVGKPEMLPQVDVGMPTVHEVEEPGDSEENDADPEDPIMQLFGARKGPMHDMSFLKQPVGNSPQGNSSNLDQDAIRAALATLLQRK